MRAQDLSDLDVGACILLENVLIETFKYHLKAHRISNKWYQNYLHRGGGRGGVSYGGFKNVLQILRFRFTAPPPPIANVQI